MPVDKDVFAFRMRQRNDFACSCGGTEIIHDANSESLNPFAGLQHLPAQAIAFRCERLSDPSGGEIAEQRIGRITWVDEVNRGRAAAAQQLRPWSRADRADQRDRLRAKQRN
jgi:hypothetical protein